MSRKKETTGNTLDEMTQRIEHLRDEANLSRMAFCRMIDFPYIRYHHITGERRSKPTADLITSVVSHTNVNPDWLIKGKGPVYRDESPEGADGASMEHYVLVPLYGVQGSAGEGQWVNGEEVEDLLAFKREWITQELRTRPENLSLIHVQGESMIPTLSPGDVILLEQTGQAQVSDGIFVIRMGEALLVKRLQFLPNQEVNITSDNASYHPFRINLKEPGEDFAIIGRVIWAGRRF